MATWLIPLALALQLVLWPDLAYVPWLSERFDPGYAARSSAYFTARYDWVVAALAAQLAVMLSLASAPVSQALAGLSPARRPVLASAFVAAAWCLLTQSLMLAFRFCSRHLLDVRFGLSNQAPWAWLQENALEQGLESLVVIATVAIVAALALRCGEHWWKLAAAVVSTGLVAIVTLQPILIDPLFDPYSRLQDRPGSQRLLELARNAGFDASKLWVCHASHRTKKTNAFIDGLGPTERIALWDTLLDSQSGSDVELVLAHELGHWRHGHTRIGTALGVLAVVAGLGFLGWLFPVPGPRQVPALLLAFWLANLTTLPTQNYISRQIETQADRYALESTGRRAEYIDAEIELTRKNLGKLDPPPVLVWLFYTHPPVADRVALALR